jgi:sugar lactone lactonase YvrE
VNRTKSNGFFSASATLALIALLALPVTGIAQLAPTATPPKPLTAMGPSGSQAELGRWLTQAAQAYQQDDYSGWVRALEQLHSLRPFNADFMRQLVEGYSRLGDRSKAFNMMLRMQQQGLSEDWASVDGLDVLRPYPLYGHLSQLMAEAGRPFGRADLAVEIPGDIAMPEALAMDPTTSRLFVGTVRDGAILVRGKDDDAFRPFASPETVDGLMAVFDLIADPERGHLWVATGSTSQYRGATSANFGRTSLIRLDLATGEKQAEFRVLPDGKPHLLGAMALADDGTVYAADNLTPFVYRLVPGEERPEIVLGNPVFTGFRGIALSPDATKLYVADYELGLFVYQTEGERRGLPLPSPETLNLGGIDGLYRWENSLIAIQNGISPSRVLRLDLDASGTRVESVAPLVVSDPRFDIPTFGTLVDDELYFLASSHWDKVTPAGLPAAGPLPAVAVLRSPVNEAQNLVVGQEMLEQMLDQFDRQRSRESSSDGEG